MAGSCWSLLCYSCCPWAKRLAVKPPEVVFTRALVALCNTTQMTKKLHTNVPNCAGSPRCSLSQGSCRYCQVFYVVQHIWRERITPECDLGSLKAGRNCFRDLNLKALIRSSYLLIVNKSCVWSTNSSYQSPFDLSYMFSEEIITPLQP